MLFSYRGAIQSRKDCQADKIKHRESVYAIQP